MPQQFQGVVGRTIEESTPAWPQPVRAPDGAPNVLFIVLDDVGYGQISCFGGLCETPNLDRLAANGLRYSNFHTTALCSPTRSALLTGRNHHTNAMAGIVEFPAGFPGYTCEIPFENGLLPEVLTPQGYAAYAVGKWHLTPQIEMNMAAPRNRWPLGRGFERYYGFLGGDTDQYNPELVADNHYVHQPRTAEEGYHLTEDLADRAIEFLTDLRNVDSTKPFFMYFATGAGHAPHHAPAEWIDKYRGKFDMGWEKARETIFQRQKEMSLVPPNTDLTPRPHWIQVWDTLPQDEKTLYSRMMEVFAGFISHTDHHIGRVVDFIDELGELDNTIIVAISDNGASAEGGPHGSLNEAAFFNRMPESVGECLSRIDELGTPRAYNHYPFGWAWAGNTPFQRWKREVHEGGVADFCVVHWPKGIEASGEVRGQYAHVVDVTPTILELLNVQSPHQIRGVTQTPMQGTSFARTLNESGAESDHETQYYEMLGNRAIYHKGWKAVTYHGTEGMIYDGVTDPSKPFDEDQWELYHITEDFSECHDLAGELPDKLRELQDIWLVEAARNNVLPLQATFSGRGRNRPRPGGRRHRYVYRHGGAPIEYFAAANVKNRSHTITAQVEIPPEGAEGVLLSVGSRFGGFVLYVKDRRLRFDYNLLSRGHYKLQSSEDVPAGRFTLGYSFEKRGNQPFGAGGTARLHINDRVVAESAFGITVPLLFGIGEALRCGYDGGATVSDDYEAPFTFTGVLKEVVVEAEGREMRDAAQEAVIGLARQ
ncbi:MAG: arylsulfatase [Chloroflexota bacterium]|nr:arylsulfatase [Chloroflexota bacterium]